MKIPELLPKLRNSDTFALAKAISMVENRKKDYKRLLESIYPLPRKALKIGITGAPGSGKSSLIEKLIAGFRAQGLSIAVLAVDPSSPVSGGALLGDRLRMIQHSNDPNVFIRSIANRGHLGGLSLSTHEIIDLLQAAGKDVIIIETVGVGQSEVDIVNVADVVLMVLNPDSGDEIQVFKAGIIEIADIFVVNKADLGGSDTKICELRNYFSISGREPLVFPTSVKEEQGIAELIAGIRRFQKDENGRIDAKGARMRASTIEKIVLERVQDEMRRDPAIAALVAGVGADNPYRAADEIVRILKKGGLHDKED